MKYLFTLTMILMIAMAGCKKDEGSNPPGPSGPLDTWIRVLEVDSASEFARDVVETTDGGFALAGISDQGNHVWKVNGQGDTLWSRHYTVDGSFDFLNGVIALSDGGALIVGSVTPSGSPSEEALLVRTNESGGVVWQRVTNIEMGFAGWSAAQTGDGGFMVATLGGLMKVNASGDTIWTRTFGNSHFYGVVTLGDGGAIVTGSLIHDTENFSAYLLRCTANGDTVWTREIPLAGMRMYSWDIARTGDGDYVAAGQYTDFPSGDAEGGWVAKFSESGQVRWSNTYAENGYFSDLATGPDGLPVIVGGIEGASSDSDILLMKLNNSGDEVWTRTFLTALDELGDALTATSDGGFLIAGTTGGISGGDIILIKVDADGEI